VGYALNQAMKNHPSPASQLPDELWTGIWQGLPFADRIAVSHVCRDWRTLALATATVWSHVHFFSTLHYASCKCTTCMRTDPLARAFLRRRRSNIDCIPIILKRSQKSPLVITFEVFSDKSIKKSCSDQAVQTQFVDLLKPHVDRVVGFRILSDDPYEVPGLLSGLGMDTFTVIRELSCTYTGDRGPDWSGNDPRPIPLLKDTDFINAPALQRLEIWPSAVGWWIARDATYRLHNLTHLTTGIRNRETMRNIFCTCPALVYVKFGMRVFVATEDPKPKTKTKRRGGRSEASSQLEPTMDQLKPSGLDTVILSDVHANMDTTAFANEWPHFALHVREYHLDYFVDPEVERLVLPNDGVRIFDSMPTSTSMLIALDQSENRCRILAFDDHGMIRGISFGEDLWSVVVNSVTIEGKEIHSFLWESLSVAHFTNLTLRLGSHQSFWLCPPSCEISALTKFEMIGSSSAISRFTHTDALRDWRACLPAVVRISIQQNDAQESTQLREAVFDGWEEAVVQMPELWAEACGDEPKAIGMNF